LESSALHLALFERPLWWSFSGCRALREARNTALLYLFEMVFLP
jgi:hypothetical protein